VRGTDIGTIWEWMSILKTMSMNVLARIAAPSLLPTRSNATPNLPRKRGARSVYQTTTKLHASNATQTDVSQKSIGDPNSRGA
jgi:hypothetical protein